MHFFVKVGHQTYKHLFPQTRRLYNFFSLLGLTTDSQPGVSDARKKAVVKRKSVPHTPASNSGAKKAKSDDEDHHQEVDVKRIKAEPEPSGSGQQAVMGDEGGIGDDSYAGIF